MISPHFHLLQKAMKKTPGAPLPGNVDEYLAAFPAEVQEALQKLRSAIRAAAPEAEEIISYRIPPINTLGRWFISQHSKTTARSMG